MRDNRTTLTEHLIRQVRVVHSDGGGLKGHKSTLIFFFSQRHDADRKSTTT